MFDIPFIHGRSDERRSERVRRKESSVTRLIFLVRRIFPRNNHATTNIFNCMISKTCTIFLKEFYSPKVVLTLNIGICMAVIEANWCRCCRCRQCTVHTCCCYSLAECNFGDFSSFSSRWAMYACVQITKLIFIDYNNCGLNTDPTCSSLLFTHPINYYCQFTNIRTHTFNNRSVVCVPARFAKRPL